VKRMMVVVTSLTALLAMVASAPPVHARSSRRARIQACSDKSAGDPCTYTSKGETVSGTCESTRRKKLICKASSGESGGAMNAPAGGEGATGGSSMGGGATGSPSPGTEGGPAGAAPGGATAP
jgi:hypothetical protein